MQVFETMETASEYRELVTQQLKTGMSDIITLDLGRISSKGITAGSSFQVRQNLASQHRPENTHLYFTKQADVYMEILPWTYA